MTYESNSPEDTINIARLMGKKALPGQIYCLRGDLGAGKTVFSKGFAQGLNIDEYIVSPTFTILNVYEGRLNFYHFDMYRIEDEDEIINTGYEEYFYGGGVCLIEWPEMVKGVIPAGAFYIDIEKDMEKGGDYRLITVTPPLEENI